MKIGNTANVPYSSFTRRQKWLLVALVSVAATFSAFASNIYFPALPAVAADLGVSATLVNLTVTSYMVLQAIAPSFWGAAADAYGRRPVFLATFIVFLAACIGLARAPNYAALVALRCLQSAGSASTIALGAGVVGDVTTRAERGGFMGIFQSGLLVPVAVGPVIGGAIAGTLGWRWIFWVLAVYAGVFLVVLAVAFPETLRSIVGDGSQKPHGIIYRYPLSLYQNYQKAPPADEKTTASSASRKPMNLLAPLRILADRRAVPVVAFLAIHYTIWQMGVTVTSTQFAAVYGLGEAQIGLVFIANGVGCITGTLSTGKLLDVDYRRVRAAYDAARREASLTDVELQQKKNYLKAEEDDDDDADFPLERARLRLMPALSLLQCAAVLVFGWTLAARAHMAAPIVASFVVGWTAVSIQSATTTYLVDLFPDAGASAGAALNFARCLLGAAGTAAADPLIFRLGVGGCFSLLAGLMLLGLALLGAQAWLRRRARARARRSMAAQPGDEKEAAP